MQEQQQDCLYIKKLKILFFEAEDTVYHDNSINDSIYKQFLEEFINWLDKKQSDITFGEYIKQPDLYPEYKTNILKNRSIYRRTGKNI